MELDDGASLLTTFNTHQGRYRFKPLPFGLNLSQDVFQEHMDHMLRQLTGIINIADDIIVFGHDLPTHDANLNALMKRATEYGLVFNADKCSIGVKNVSFFGLIYSEEGTRPDPKRTDAISRIPPPTDVTSVRSFLGIANYMSPFVPNITELLAPLRELTHKNITFQWSQSHQAAFEGIKEKLCYDSSLAYFNAHEPPTIQVDASGVGLGAVLVQNNRPVAFASRSLTDVERRYSNIERELLAVTFGCERFHHYVYGKEFTIDLSKKPRDSEWAEGSAPTSHIHRENK